MVVVVQRALKVKEEDDSCLRAVYRVPRECWYYREWGAATMFYHPKGGGIIKMQR